MFNSLFNSLFGKSKDNNFDSVDNENSEQTSGDLSKRGEGNVTAVAADGDTDWLIVKRIDGEDSDSECTSISKNNLQVVPFKNILSHLNPIGENDENLFIANLPSFYPNTMDESWFLTPPECFSTVSSIQLESSPLENLLIEHPSMSVYYNFRRRGPLNSISNGEAIDDLVVIELSQNDEEQSEKVPSNKNRDKRNNKKSRSNGAQKNVALVLVKKNNGNNQKQDQRKPSVGKSAFERNNKCYALRHAPKRTTVINQPSSRSLMIANKKN